MVSFNNQLGSPKSNIFMYEPRVEETNFMRVRVHVACTQLFNNTAWNVKVYFMKVVLFSHAPYASLLTAFAETMQDWINIFYGLAACFRSLWMGKSLIHFICSLVRIVAFVVSNDRLFNVFSSYCNYLFVELLENVKPKSN